MKFISHSLCCSLLWKMQWSMLSEMRAMVIFIRLRSFSENGNLYILITDNGKGMTGEELASLKQSLNREEVSDESIGLVNVHQRIRLFLRGRLRNPHFQFSRKGYRNQNTPAPEGSFGKYGRKYERNRYL